MEILTVDQAAELLQANRTTVQDYCRDGKIPARKVGRSWRIRRDELLVWVGGTATTPTAAQKQVKRSKNPFCTPGFLK